jgi:hypothetical protein
VAGTNLRKTARYAGKNCDPLQAPVPVFQMGLNNKAKVTMRRSYGFRTFRVLELALYHTLGKLPEPKLTHEFF